MKPSPVKASINPTKKEKLDGEVINDGDPRFPEPQSFSPTAEPIRGQAGQTSSVWRYRKGQLWVSPVFFQLAQALPGLEPLRPNAESRPERCSSDRNSACGSLDCAAPPAIPYFLADHPCKPGDVRPPNIPHDFCRSFQGQEFHQNFHF